MPVGVELGVGEGRNDEEEEVVVVKKEEEEDETGVGEEEEEPACSRTFRMSSGLPMTMPMAPEM